MSPPHSLTLLGDLGRFDIVLALGALELCLDLSGVLRRFAVLAFRRVHGWTTPDGFAIPYTIWELTPA